MKPSEMDAFVAFSDAIYEPAFRTEDKAELRALLMKQHALSHYFTVIPIVVKQANDILARCVVTIYPDDEVAYMGYFESVENHEAARLLFSFAEQEAKQHEKFVMEGPLNASFWLGYRLKVNAFTGRPYFGELYHHSYYQELWSVNGFEQTETYFSNHYVPVDEQMNQAKYSKRFDQFLQKGYQFKSPTRKTMDIDFLAVAELIQERFQTFPAFKGIELAEFMDLFVALKQILHERYVKLAFDQNDELVGFLISLPDYGNLFKKEKRGVATLLRFIWKKYTTRHYVILYMGVKEGHEGLGSALVYTLMESYRKRKIKAISSYIQAGKVSGSYAFPSVERQNAYAYYRKTL